MTVANEDLDHSLAPILTYSSFWYVFFQGNLEAFEKALPSHLSCYGEKAQYTL